MRKCEDYKGLLVGLLDHELTPEEIHEVNSHLIRCQSCRSDFDKLRETSKQLDSAAFAEPGDEVLDRVWNRPYSRWTRNAAWFLILGGYLTLLLYGLYEFFRGDDGHALVRVAVAAIVIGIVFLLFQLIRERCLLWKIDPYKHIKR